MSFWFSPSRSAEKDKDLHSTDITFLNDLLGNDPEDSCIIFGNKGLANIFCDILPQFNETVNKWASPELVEKWGKFLSKLDQVFHDYEEEPCEFSIYADRFIKIGKRGIGLYLSW